MKLLESVLMTTGLFKESIDTMDKDLRKGRNKDKRITDIKLKQCIFLLKQFATLRKEMKCKERECRTNT